MPIEFRCNKCQTLLRTPDETVGRAAVCPQCGRQMEVPYVSAPTSRNPYVVPEDDAPPPTTSPPASTADQMAIWSLVLGIVALLFSCCCLIGLPASIAGLVCGMKGLDSRNHGIAIAGIVLCAIGVLVNLGFVGVHVATDSGMFQGHNFFP